MSICVKGKVKLTCEKCGKTHIIKSEMIDMEVLEPNSECGMGPKVHYEAEYNFDCDCKKPISLSVDAWEYPIGVLNGNVEHKIIGAKIVGKFDVTFDVE